MTTGKHRLSQATKTLNDIKQNVKKTYSGLLGCVINGTQTISVPYRTGYVYVRLRDNTSEVLQAYNDSVALIYGLPIIVSRDVSNNRYVVEGRDIARYDNWGTSSSYLPLHGDTHSFGDTFVGNDITWVYDRQFMPLGLSPSGSLGSANVSVHSDVYYQNGIWKYAGNTGTPNLLAYKPTGAVAKIVLIYLDGDGNPQVEEGSTFATTITGIAGIIPYLPSLPSSLAIPLGAVRLLSGTTAVEWDNIYDLRPLVVGATRYDVQNNGVTLPKQNYLNFVGDLVWAYDDPVNGITVVRVSGTTHFIDDISTSGSVYGHQAIFDTAIIGNYGAGNYTEIQSDGSMIARGNATCWRDELQSVTATRLTSPSGDFVLNDPEGSVTAKSSARYDTDYISMNLQINHDWATGTAIYPHLHWWQIESDIPNWLLSYRWQKQGANKTATWSDVAWDNNAFSYNTGTLNQITNFGAINVPSGYGQVSDIVQFRLYRDYLNTSTMFTGTDGVASDVDFVNLDIHIQVNTLGSRTEYSK